MARAGAGRVISEAELTAEKLTAEIFSLLDHLKRSKNFLRLRADSPALMRARIVNLIEEAAKRQEIR